MKTKILSILLLLCVCSPLAAQADEYSIGISNLNTVEDSIYYESFKDSIVRFRSEQPREVNPDTTSTAVGAMGGTFGVSATGGATYTIPIEVPQGIGGLQPTLSIVYNSQAGNGLCGYGANLAGLSSITRGPKDIYHDGSAGGINYWIDDAFYLDGVRLIHVSGTPGSYGTVYVPESDPFTRVITHGSCNSTSDNTWFEVQTPDGMIYWYGNSSASRLIYTDGNKTKIQSWNLSHVRQPSGNFMNLFYQTECNCLYPSTIAYGDNLNRGNHLHDTIYFSYESRGDSLHVRFDGQQGSMRRRLKSITGKSNGSIYRSYILNYDTISDGTSYKYSRLVSVTEKNSQNETLPSTQFEWAYLPAVNYSSNNLLVSAPSNLGWGISFPFSDQNLLSGDFNNDGLTDIVGMGTVVEPNGNGGYDYHTYAYIYYANRSSSGSVSYTHGQKYVLPPTFDRSIMEAGIKSLSVLDIDGDGFNELIVPYYLYTGYGNGTIDIHVIGQNYSANSYFACGLYGNAKPIFSTGDINNDGRSDVVLIETTTYNGEYPLLFMQYNPDFISGSQEMAHCLFDVSIETSLSLSSSPQQAYLTDMNGNGLNDLFIICSDGYAIYWNQGGPLSENTYSDTHKITGTNPHDVRSLTPGDFNGDGLLDLLSNTKGSNYWYFYLNKGDGTFKQTTALEMSIISDQSFTLMDDNMIFANVVDYDNDGRSDVIISKGVFKTGLNQFDYAITKWLTSTGTALVEKYSATSCSSYDLDPGKYITGDFDGDGHMDLVNYGYDCVGGSYYNTVTAWRIYKNDDLTTQTGRITSITGDFGATTNVTYSTLPDSEVYTCEIYHSYPAPTYTIPLNVVKRTNQGNGAADSLTTQYSYELLKIHISGRGMIGFCETKTNCLTTGVITDNNIYQFHSELYIPKKRNTRTIIGNDVAERITTMTISNQGNKKYFAYPSQIEDTDFDGNTITTTRSFNTTYGYPTSETITYGTNMYRSISYSDYILAGGSYHPQTVVSSQRHPDHRTPFSKTTKYVYDNNTGSVISEVDNYGSSKPLTTNYTYDDFGNLTSKVSTGNGITTPVTIYYTYERSHRFPVRKYTSPASTVQKYTYDLWGDVLTEQDSINSSITNTITHTYDAWGNLIRTQAPDGTETTYSRGWNNSPSLRWFILEQGTATPWVKTWYDNRCREVKTESVGPMNVEVSSTTTYNSKGLVSGRTDSKGNLTLSYSYTYDTRGRLTSETAPGNHTFSYQYGNRTVTVTENGNRTTTKTYDAWGNLKTLTDPVSSITNLYASCGDIRRTTVEGSTWIFQYDDRGNRTSMTDPDAGTTTYVYDALGRETQHVDGRGVVFVTNYDYLGRVTSRTATQGNTSTISYTYGTSGTGQMRVTGESNGTWTKSYVYDTYGRVTSETMSNGTDITRSRSYQYGSNGLLSKRILPGNMEYDYTYDTYGNLTCVSGASGAVVWTLAEYTGRRTVSHTALDGSTYPFVKTTRLDQYGYLDSLKTHQGNCYYQEDKYVFSPQTGNLMSMQKMNMYYPAYFTYDNADRLNLVQYNNQNIFSTSYAPNGNITFKNDMGSYTYDNTSKPHAVTSVQNTDNLINYNDQYITYNPWGKVEGVWQTDNTDFYSYSIEYGPDLQRVTSGLGKTYHTEYEKFYWDDYEEKTTDGITTRYYYVYGGDGLAGLYMETDVPNINEVDTHSLAAMTDHLGSITAMADNSDWCYEAGYDMWGKRSAQYVFCDDFGFDRGFTGHEHIDALGLIDMNGRMYDPLQGRFLSPDNYIQSPGNPQNYNRYSYCLNNPLKYTDPDGESWLIAGVVALMLLTEEGYNIQKAISPVALHFDVHLGTHQLGLGYDVSIGFPTSSPISYRNHYGETYYWKTYGGNSGWEYREGGEWGLQGLPYGIPYYINFSGTEFSGINSQTTNSVSFSKLPFMRTTYENDTELFVKLPGVPEYDNNDRYRTAAVSIKRGPFTLQTNLHTGMAGKKGENIDGDGTEENPFHFIGGDIDKQHHGILSLGIGPFRFGWDSEGIRHTLQNRLAHDWMWYYNYGYMYSWVQDNEREDSFFFYLGSGTGNTMW